MSRTDITPEQKLAQTRESANNRRYVCTITLDNVKLLMAETHCQYTGVQFSDDPRQNQTFERVDNSMGYVPGNVIPVTLHVNNLKGSLSLVELKKRANNWQNRRKPHMDTIVGREHNIKKKINTRLKQIEELQEANKRSQEELLLVEKERMRAQANIDEDIEDQKIYGQIVHVIETNRDIGHKYLTPIQKIKVKALDLIKNNWFITVLRR
jgi:hypothetical protein